MDLRRIYALQALRAFAYGFGSVLLGASLARSQLSGAEVGLVFTSMLAGSAFATLLLARRADVLGRRRTYALLSLMMAGSGAVVAITDSLPLLVLAGLTGTLSVEVVESGPFTSVEQAMIPQVAGADTPAAFGRYNAIAALVGAAGALLAGGPAALRELVPSLPPDQRWLLVYPAVGLAGAILARRLSAAVEGDGRRATGRLGPSRTATLRLAGLFAIDSFAGGFIVQSFIVFWFTDRYDAPTALMGVVMAAAGAIQSASFIAAPRIARRYGLLNTMVFTHLPSNVLLTLIPFAPNLASAIALLLVRFPLSQMDVPTRQAYLAALVHPEERASAASVTNAARTIARPLSAPVAGVALGSSIPGLAFFLAGAIKAVYDIALFASFRRVPLTASWRTDDAP